MLPTLLRSHSLYASAPQGAASRGRRRPPRRSCTVDVVTEVMRTQHEVALQALPGRRRHAAKAARAVRAEALHDATLHDAALNAIAPCPATPTPPATAPASPRRASASTPSPPFRPRVVEMYLKQEVVPEPGWV